MQKMMMDLIIYLILLNVLEKKVMAGDITLNTTPVTWDTALTVCNSRGQNLVQIYREAKNHLLKEHLSSYLGMHIWIGLYAPNPSDNTNRIWSDDGSSPIYENWSPSKTEGAGYLCTYIVVENTGLEWNLADCDTKKKSFMCEEDKLHVRSQCPACFPTTEYPTTEVQTTTEDHTTEEHTTTEDHTTGIHTTTEDHTTEEHTTTEYHTTEVQTTTEDHTTEEHTTTEDHTTEVQTTTEDHTTEEHTTTEDHTNEVQTTTEDHTTEEHTTTEDHTTEEHTTTEDHTTEVQTTIEDHTTEEHTTTEDHTTGVHTTTEVGEMTTEDRTTTKQDDTTTEYRTKETTLKNEMTTEDHATAMDGEKTTEDLTTETTKENAMTTEEGTTIMKVETSTGVKTTQTTKEVVTSIGNPARPGGGISPYCTCTCQNVTTTLSLEESIQEIVNNIKVDKRKMSSHTRKLTSAKDSRPSSASIGYCGIVMLSTTFGMLVFLDFHRLIDKCCTIFKRKKDHHRSQC
ncbi:uncharacterized protein LOC134695932 [Mytilus trossulus]|uniref:uncharacterized protein LOC134695932 n=1 Tax=Mytilus trossulus TaxID=6551 RepID=UPI003003F361